MKWEDAEGIALRDHLHQATSFKSDGHAAFHTRQWHKRDRDLDRADFLTDL